MRLASIVWLGIFGVFTANGALCADSVVHLIDFRSAKDFTKRTGIIIVSEHLKEELFPSLRERVRHSFGLASTSARLALEKYPVLQLVVVPVPPLDYRVEINGLTFEATKETSYLLYPGATINLKVTRLGAEPCVWTGKLKGNQRERVECKF